MEFEFLAFDAEGKQIKDKIVEDDLDLAIEQLKARNFQLISIRRKFSMDKFSFNKKLNEEQLANFCGEVGIIFDSGVTIIRGLEIQIAQTQKKNYKAVLVNIYKNVKKGLNLSTAMKQVGVFPELLTDMVASGEMTSHLAEILFSMEDFYKREAAIKSKIKSASIYPVILLCAAVVMVLFFNVFVFSELKSLFDGIDNLPFITSVLIQSLNYLNSHPINILLAIAIAIIGYQALIRLDMVRQFMDRISLNIPVVGAVKMNIITSRVASSMAIFIKSAVPLVKVLTVVELLVDNQYISNKMSGAKEHIIRGQNIADAFEDCDVFDPMLVQMIRVGEETGKLEEMLFRLADIYEKRTETGITSLVALIEPAFTLVVGVLVGIIILAMAMPIFNMSSMYR